MSKNVRLSNIELLRIVSMSAVILVHLDGAALGLPSPSGPASVSGPDIWKLIVESLTIVGVNCFTLISGYFGIKASVNGLLRLTATCIFYSVGLYTLAAATGIVEWSSATWLESWMVYTHTDLWYVPAYMLLYLVSPFLNAAISSMSDKQLTLWTALFTAANIWCGWVWNASFNPTGYTPVQLIMIYLIGRWLSRRLAGHSPRSAWPPFAFYLLSAGMTFAMSLYMESVKAFAYNAPWVIASSVALFIVFARLKLQSAHVNSLAKGAFAAYLIHKNPLVWGGIIRPAAIHVWQQHSLILYSVFCVGFTSLIYATSTAADAVRQWLFGKLELLSDYKIKI
ncbi:MAG: acyltransferase [Paramuribaculum sp.]|nr:acyltransferase [Paramuribaculum sp.]